MKEASHEESHSLGFHVSKMFRRGQSIETESRLVKPAVGWEALPSAV